MDKQKKTYGQTDTDLWTDKHTDLWTDIHRPMDRHTHRPIDRHRPMDRRTYIHRTMDRQTYSLVSKVITLPESSEVVSLFLYSITRIAK